MNLYPQDLRDRLHAAIIRGRAYGVYGGVTPTAYLSLAADLPSPRLGKLGRVWTCGLELTQHEAATGLPAASIGPSIAQWAVPVIFGILLAPVALSAAIVTASPDWPLVAETLAAWGAVTGLSMTLLPRHTVRGLYKKPLSAPEIDALLPNAKNNIDRAYLELMRAAIEQTVPPDTEAGLREALRALGRAADSLPPAVSVPRDPETLRREAAAVRARALQEQDEVVAASGERQAEALERQAAALDRAAVVTRRGQVLHAEVLAQIEALHAGLTDFRADAATDTALLSILAEDARRVAQEASNVAQARAELDAFAAAPTRQSATPTEGALKVGQE